MAGETPLNLQMLVMGLSRIAKSAAGTSVAYTELIVEEKEVDNIELIRGYPNLHHVSLGGNKLTDLSPLGDLPDLLTLDVSNNLLSEALDLGGKTSNNLSRAILSGNKITGLMCLAPHVHLQTLMIADNNIYSLEPLSGLPQLRYVDASSNQLSCVEGMCGQPITELHLSNNRITTFEGGMSSLKDLEVLTVNDNKLKTLHPLNCCERLIAIEAQRNLLEMETVVVPLQGLCFLRHLRLAGNPAEQGMVMPGQSMSSKYKDMPLPDFRRLVYRWRLVYRLLRLETLDGEAIVAGDKVASANFNGADRDAHDHCYAKYFPISKEPMRGRELTIARLHRPEPHQDGEMLFPDVWLHRLVQRTLELDWQAVRVKGAWDADSTIDPAEETQAITIVEPTRVIIICGVVNSCNLGVQKCSSSVAVVTKEELPWRVRQIHSCLDHEHHGLALLSELQAIDNKFFGEPAPRIGLRADEEGYVTAGQLVEWFEQQREEMGLKAVEEVVVRFEAAIEEMGVALPAPAITTYLESGHSKVVATVEGELQPGTYQVAARCSLSEQGALEKASGGEPFFLTVMGDKEFRLGGIESRSMSSQQGAFSNSFNRPLSRKQILHSRTGAKSVEPLGPMLPQLTEEKCVGRYGSRKEVDGLVYLRTMELFNDNTCQFSLEQFPAGEKPTLEAEWLDGAWGVQSKASEEDGDESEQRLVLEGVSENDASFVGMFSAIGDRPTRFPAGFEQESVDTADIATAEELAAQFLSVRWLSSVKYRDEVGEDLPQYQREKYAAEITQG